MRVRKDAFGMMEAIGTHGEDGVGRERVGFILEGVGGGASCSHDRAVAEAEC